MKKNQKQVDVNLTLKGNYGLFLMAKNGSRSILKNIIATLKMTKTLIDDLDFDNLEKYQSRSLVAWLKRNTGSQEQKELVQQTIEKRKFEVFQKIRDRVQINYRLSIETSEKIRKICKKIGCYKTIKINDESVFLECKDKSSIEPTELARLILEEKIQELYDKVFV